jgi:hypothetical protein
MRNFINILEEGLSPSARQHIAFMVSQGHHEGFNPYWKLNADPNILSDRLAMQHIADLIIGGETLGHQPTWDLKTVGGDTDEAAPEPEVDETAFVPTDAFAAPLDEDDKEVAPKHRVVAVHQKEGHGNGWWECPDEHAELFVVEDDEGNPLESYHDRNSAEAHAHHLNTGEQVLDEIDEVPTDGAVAAPEDMAVPTMYADDPDHVVEVAAMHERGHAQDEAFREMALRGIQLTPEQERQAGRTA